MDHWLRKYLVPLYQAPDDVPAVDPAPPPAPNAAVVAAADPPAPADPPLESLDTPEPVVAPKPRAPDPLISTITGLRAKNRDLEGRAERAEREAADARAVAERLARGTDPPVAPQPQPTFDANRYANDVRTEAQNQRIAEDSVAILNAGNAAFKDFGDSRNILTALGAFENNDFVADLVAVDKDNAHIIIDRIAKEPERAAALVGMDSRRRIAEMTRLAMTATASVSDPAPAASVPVRAAAPARSVSRAPAPAPVVTPSASKIVDWRADEASDEEFTKGFQETMAKRAARR